MPTTTNSLFDLFKTKFESLQGHVHIASSWEEAARNAAEICRDAGARCVALGEMPANFQSAFTALCQADGIRLLEAPHAADTLPGAIDEAEVGITWIDFAIARTGTLVETALDDATRLVSALPRTHIGLVSAREFVDELEAAAPRIRQTLLDNPENCTVSFLSGPSRTGDIEMKLTLGVHGPEAAHAIVLAETLEIGPSDG